MTGNIPSSSKGNIGKNNVIENVEDDIYELPDPDFSKSAAIEFDEIDNGEAGVLPSPKCFD